MSIVSMKIKINNNQWYNSVENITKQFEHWVTAYSDLSPSKYSQPLADYHSLIVLSYF